MTVYLVGAGPGDPELLTVRAAALLGVADVVVHDRLVDDRVIALAPVGADRRDVGKRAGVGTGAPTQAEINELLIELGHKGGVVVRLKGGDPYVLGRGGEEALALSAVGIDYEVVPGITAAIAVASYAGVPLTHRGIASGFAVVSGHDAEDSGAIDWPALATSGLTIVVLMAVSTRAAVARRLLAAGRDPATPVLVVENGTTARQRSIRTTLAELPAVEVVSPATLVIGDAAGLSLASYEQRPLFGRRIVVTRPSGQIDALVESLALAGALPIEFAVIEIGPPADGGAALRSVAARLGEFAWVVFTSANGVDRLAGEIRDARAFGSARVAAIGSATAEALKRLGVVADLVPERYVGESLVAAFPLPSADLLSNRVLVARAAVARDVLPEGLSALGWDVEVVDAYATSTAEPAPSTLERLVGSDTITFTSPSAVTAFLELAGRDRLPGVVASIGPVTSAAARTLGITVDVEAERHDVSGLIDALVAHASSEHRASPFAATPAESTDR